MGKSGEMNFSDNNVLVVGMGRSGVASAEKLKQLRAQVTAVDTSTTSEIREISSQLEHKGIHTKLGEHELSDLNEKDLIVVSPGVPPDILFLNEAKKRGIKIWSEVELAYRLLKENATIIGVTGTNGKTTTTKLIGAIFRQARKPCIVTGNIGFPFIKSLSQVEEGTILVVELSSFQLHNILNFRPQVSVLLNITEDHLDWHMDFDEYIKDKKQIFKNQAKGDFAIVNYDDPVVKKISQDVYAQVIPFSKSEELRQGIVIKGGSIVSCYGQEEQEIIKTNELKIIGHHNWENAMAAIGAGLTCNIRINNIREALLSFKGLSHRLEFVVVIEGVSYYNDSKATNPDATMKALTAFKTPVILLAGGRNKGNSFVSLIKEVKKKVKTAILFGESKEEMVGLCRKFGVDYSEALTIKEAVQKGKDASEAGDVVLFSPACASYDMFKNYEERGDEFKQELTILKQSGKK